MTKCLRMGFVGSQTPTPQLNENLPDINIIAWLAKPAKKENLLSVWIY